MLARRSDAVSLSLGVAGMQKMKWEVRMMGISGTEYGQSDLPHAAKAVRRAIVPSWPLNLLKPAWM
jgi:hypothetical protein